MSFTTAVAAVVAVALSADLVQVLEYIPAEETFVLRSGRGFSEALHDQARVKGGLLSQAGRAMLDPLAQPVSLKDFREPHDWADDELVVEHGARGGIAVKVEGGSQDFGALCAFYRSPRTFTSEEVAFMDCAARLFCPPGSTVWSVRRPRRPGVRAPSCCGPALP